jgi:hypothetical protein
VIDAALRAGAGARSVADAFGYMCMASVLFHRRDHLRMSVDDMKRACFAHRQIDLAMLRDEGAPPDLREALWMCSAVGGYAVASQLMNYPQFLDIEERHLLLIHERGTFEHFFSVYVDKFRRAVRNRAKAEEVLAYDCEA